MPQNEDLKYQILFEAHDTTLSGHLGRKKTYGSVSQHYGWSKLYKWVSTYVRTCETCQRVKPSAHSAVPLARLPVPTVCWEFISMDFVLGLPKDSENNTEIVVFVDRLSKMAHLAVVPDSIDGKGTDILFIDRVFYQHGLPLAIIPDRDPRFTGNVWTSERCLARDWTCPQRIIRRAMVRLSELIASLATLFTVFVLSRLRLGSRCSLSLSLR